MYYRIISSIFIFFFSIQLTAQQPQFSWVNGINGVHSQGRTIHSDHEGNIISAGWFQGTVDLDPGQDTLNFTWNPGVYSYSSSNYVQKLNGGGELIWAKQMNNCHVYEIEVDSSANIYLFGTFYDTLQFEPPIIMDTFVSVDYWHNYFIVKLDAQGNYVWGKAFENDSSYYGSLYYNHVFIVDDGGNSLLSLHCTDSMDVDPGTGVEWVDSGMYVLKLDAIGDFEWAKPIGGTGTVGASDIGVDGSGNVYLTGSYSGIIDFNPSPLDTNLMTGVNSSVYILKLNPSGDYIWSKRLDASGNFEWNTWYYQHQRILVSDTGNVYLTGRFNGISDFDPDTGVFNMTPIVTNGWQAFSSFFLKLNASGDFEWAKQIGTDAFLDSELDDSENLYINGRLTDTVDLDPDTGVFTVSSNVTLFYGNSFFAKYSSSGEFQWGYKADFHAWDMDLGLHSSINTTGLYHSQVDFNPDTLYESYLYFYDYYNHAFTHKMTSCEIESNYMRYIACNNYESPSGNYIWTESGSYVDSIFDSFGCPSVYFLDLEIGNVDASVSQYGDSLATATIGASYQWLDCDNNFAPISGATNQWYVTNITGNYALQITGGGCVDTSECFTINTVGIADEFVNESILIYPNPSKDELNINLAGLTGDITVQIYDQIGKKISSESYSNSSSIRTIINGSPGIYIVEISDGKGRKYYYNVVKE